MLHTAYKILTRTPGSTVIVLISSRPCMNRTCLLVATASAVSTSELTLLPPHAKPMPNPPRKRTFLIEPLAHCGGSAGSSLTVKMLSKEGSSGA